MLQERKKILSSNKKSIILLFTIQLKLFMTNFSNKYSSKEQEVAETEIRLKALIEATSDVVYSLSSDWKEMRELDGRGFLKDADAPTTDWKSVNVYPDDLDLVNATIEECIREKKVFQLEHRVQRADGTPG